ncbi:crossover junction endodeoxyribonuclease RuvC [Hydrogenivirga sp. 128-5-R1-1]|uniref:crossover junction endodeoxyribonuclease RuvC n=1 Tax=Hydrogenivirga sp. 128-5-R1-1 TaxID=392423 RepID=UPI00015F12AD|nr:crossover junction endodeoxyribonuclease RuvC [Hydrogenivirga sp. 128-5-R1-1]EDP73740.1 hypothetical protein HG1285_11048 [Hydrogenivirga sp. 128-5-R1-1]
MSIIAIDPGIEKTGYAVGANNKVLEIGTIKTSKKDGTDFDRVSKIKEAVRDLILKHQVSLMLIEEYHVYGNPFITGGKSHGEKTIKVITALEFLANEIHIDCQLIHYKSWKASFDRIKPLITMSPKFKTLNKLYESLLIKANYTQKGTKRKGKKEDHELDAFRMLIPEIIDLKAVISQN